MSGGKNCIVVIKSVFVPSLWIKHESQWRHKWSLKELQFFLTCTLSDFFGCFQNWPLLAIIKNLGLSRLCTGFTL